MSIDNKEVIIMVKKFQKIQFPMMVTIKFIASISLSGFSYICWLGGKLASTEIQATDNYKIMLFGIVIGILGILSINILISIVYDFIRRIRLTKLTKALLI